MVSKWVGEYWGYNPLTNHLLTSWDIQAVLRCSKWSFLKKKNGPPKSCRVRQMDPFFDVSAFL